MQLRWAGATTILILLILGTACSSASLPRVNSADIRLVVQRDGSLEVTETLRINFAQPQTSFRRTSPSLFHDGISDVRATLDGEPLPASGARRAESASGNSLDVTWHFPALSGEHTLGLTYRAAQTVAVSGIRGRVSWLALPAGRGFDVGGATVVMTLPEGTVQLEDPWVMEAGWSVTRAPQGFMATRTNIPAGESATVGAEFSVDTLKLPRPVWQYHAERAVEFMPAFLSAGVFLLVVAAGVIVMNRVRLRSLEPGALEVERLTAVRGMRITGIVTIVAGALGWPLVSATLGTFGPWPFALPACTMMSGVLFLIDARGLTRAGARG